MNENGMLQVLKKKNPTTIFLKKIKIFKKLLSFYMKQTLANQCARSEVAQMWNNVQLHNHWTMAQAPFYCDREQIMTVARSVFDISSGSGQVFFDLDGSTHGRHLWYLELISLPNDKSKIDVVGEKN